MNNKQYIIKITEFILNDEDVYYKYDGIFTKILNHHNKSRDTDSFGVPYWEKDRSLNFKLKILYNNIIK